MITRTVRLHKPILLTFTLLFVLAVSISSAWAQPIAPSGADATTYRIHFQGRLLTPGTGVPKPDGVYPITFAIYDVSSGGSALWSETKNVTTSNGNFATLLGDTTPLVLAYFDGQDLWLGIKVSADAEAAPRQRIAYTPYALYATSAGNAATAGDAATLGGSSPSAFAPAAHDHAGSAITSGTVAEARIDDTLARDSEVGALATASGLMASKTHSHLGETWSGTDSILKIDGSYGVAPLVIDNAVFGNAIQASSVGPAVQATSSSSDGFQVSLAADDGVQVTQANYGFYVANAAIYGVLVGNATSSGVFVSNSAGDGLKVYTAGAPTGAAVESPANNGVEIANAQGNGVFVGRSDGDGVHVESGGFNAGYFNTGVSNGNGIAGIANNGTAAYGVFGSSASGYAGYFAGKVHVSGTLTKGAGAFKIDHPLDPANKYLYHSFVESPDMKNIYDGVVQLDSNGEAVVQLPDWFQALNGDFRYQLTCIGGYAPVYIAQEVSNNQFRIAGGRAGLKVSWQVTGIRHDPYAEANRIPVEEMKAPAEQGRYLFPAGYGQAGSAAKSIEKLVPVQPLIVNPTGVDPRTNDGKP